MQRHVVIIEDERDLSRLLEFNLRGAGFSVTSTATGDDGLTAVRATKPDVVVLDLMLPDRSGYDVCRAIRDDAGTVDVGVVMLTSLADAEHLRLGLQAGADDYLIKPFVVREVVARVGALVNLLASCGSRPTSGDVDGVIEVGSLQLDPVSHTVALDGVPAQLRPVEFKLLHVLVAAPGRVFTRAELFERLWDIHGDVDSRTIDVHLRRLRTSLGSAAGVIEIVAGLGYRARAS